MTYGNSYIHSYTDGSGCHTRCRPAHQEQFGVQCLAQGHFDMQVRGKKPASFQKQDAASASPQPLISCNIALLECLKTMRLMSTYIHPSICPSSIHPSIHLFSFTYPGSGQGGSRRNTLYKISLSKAMFVAPSGFSRSDKICTPSARCPGGILIKCPNHLSLLHLPTVPEGQ